jgi:hypothetical protein
MLGRALLTWLVLLVVAFLNGTFRELVLVPRVGTQVGHVVSTLMLSAAIFAVAYAVIPWIAPGSVRSALWIGAAWLCLTLAFELGFGRLLGKPWSELMADYDLSAGRIWILVLVATALAPFLAANLRRVLPPDGP